MEKEVYEKWWPLHLRKALGQPLSDEERAFYELQLKKLDDEEVIVENLEEMRALKQRIREGIAELRRLTEERIRLEAKVAALEAALPDRVRKALAVED